MTTKQRKDIYEVFAECFHDIVVPIIERLEEKMATKEDIKRLEAEMATKADKADIDRIERKLDSHTDRLDRHGKDIEKLKTKLAD